jgi:hypothetical protein
MNSAYRTYRNLIAIMIVIAWCALVFILSGCSTHKYSIVGADGGEVTIESKLEFEEVEADYKRDESGVRFRFRAGSATATPWIDEETVDAIKILSDKLP